MSDTPDRPPRSPSRPVSRIRKARPPRERGGKASKATSVCPETGKSTFITRKDARHARRTMGKPGAELNAYRCDACGYWHLGHLPDVVQNGDVARGELARRPHA